jgi:hypothetical protein
VRFERTDLTVNTVNVSKGNERFDSSIASDDFLPSLSGDLFPSAPTCCCAPPGPNGARPTHREISRAEIYDVALGRTIRGNPDLTMSSSKIMTCAWSGIRARAN